MALSATGGKKPPAMMKQAVDIGLPGKRTATLSRVLQPDSAQPRRFLVPAGTLLDVQEQMHPALEQRRQFLPRLRANGPDTPAAFADQDRLVTRTRDVHGRFDAHRAIA